MRQINEKQIQINGLLIQFDVSIKQIIEYDNVIIVMVRERKEIPNNIFAYDYSGNEIWRINDIVKAKIPRGFDEIKKVSNDILEANSELGIIYEIDVDNRAIKNKIFLR